MKNLKNRANTLIMKASLMIGLLLMYTTPVWAQFDEATDTIEEFYDFMNDVGPLILVLSFVFGAIVNIRKVWGEDRDWKGFFTAIGLWILGIGLVVGVASYIGTVSF